MTFTSKFQFQSNTQHQMPRTFTTNPSTQCSYNTEKKFKKMSILTKIITIQEIGNNVFASVSVILSFGYFSLPQCTPQHVLADAHSHFNEQQLTQRGTGFRNERANTSQITQIDATRVKYVAPRLACDGQRLPGHQRSFVIFRSQYQKRSETTLKIMLLLTLLISEWFRPT